MTNADRGDSRKRTKNQRVLVTGAGGQVGGYLRRVLEETDATIFGVGHRIDIGVDEVVDVASEQAVRACFARFSPDVVIHAAAYVDFDGCERDPGRAETVNAAGALNVAKAARDVGSYLVAISTDYVFSGCEDGGYTEDASPNPLSVYGSTKLAGEYAVLETDPDYAVARTAWVFGGPRKHFPRTVLSVIRDRGSIEVVEDEIGSPTFAADLARALVALVTVRGAGIFHLTNEGRASRYRFACEVAVGAGVDPRLIVPTNTEAFLAKNPLIARRPARTSLVNTNAARLGISLRSWEDALGQYAPRLALELGTSNVSSWRPPED